MAHSFKVVGAGNPLLDISAVVKPELLDKYVVAQQSKRYPDSSTRA